MSKEQVELKNKENGEVEVKEEVEEEEVKEEVEVEEEQQQVPPKLSACLPKELKAGAESKYGPKSLRDLAAVGALRHLPFFPFGLSKTRFFLIFFQRIYHSHSDETNM